MWYPLIRKLLFQFDAEKSHYLALKLQKISSPLWLLRRRLAKFPQHPVKLFGLTFPNPVGLAAGFDKNGDYIETLQGLGFGFVEVGTVSDAQEKTAQTQEKTELKRDSFRPYQASSRHFGRCLPP